MKILQSLIHRWIPNIVLAAGIFLFILLDLLPLAFALFVLSKWQLMFGGYRLWLYNLRDNSCDIVFGSSLIIVMHLVSPDVILQAVLAMFLLAWLLFVKPLESVSGIGLQALLCQFVGISVLFLLANSLPQNLVIFVAWFISTISMYHFLSIFHRPEKTVISFVWGFLVAEIGWLSWKWLIIYQFFDGRVQIPQIALILTILGYSLGSIYKDHAQKSLKKSRLAEYVLVSSFLVGLIIFGTEWVSQL
jgi:hypothetical protein